MRRPDLVALLGLALAAWIGRWALLELASYLHRNRVPEGPLPRESPHPPGHVPGAFDS